MHRTPTGDDSTLVDGHVHLYPRYSVRRFLDSARRNFERVGRARGTPSRGATGYLLLATGDEPSAFATLRAASRTSVGPWTLEGTDEEASLVARHEDGPTVVMIAGRQLRTGDGLEVLALCTAEDPPEGLGLERTIRAVRRAGALPVVPWGFGKWWGRRGALVRRLLEGHGGEPLLLGDNAGRPRAAPEPRLFRAARRRGVPVLPGTDPLPFAGEERKVGGYGAVVACAPGLERPAERLRDHLRDLERSPARYGEGESLGRFARHQVRMQLGKLGRGRPRS